MELIHRFVLYILYHSNEFVPPPKKKKSIADTANLQYINIVFHATALASHPPPPPPPAP